MHTSQDSAPAQRSTAERLLIRSWEYRHMRAWAGFRIGGGVALTTCGVLTLAFGGPDRKTYGWAALFLVLSGLIRVLAYEHPDLRATLVDLDAAADR